MTERDSHSERGRVSWLSGSRWIGRGALLLFLVLFLAASIYFQEEHIETLELNTKASGYVVAEVDFYVPDVAAMSVFRQEHSKDIRRIYEVSRVGAKKKREYFRAFLLDHPSWRDQFNDISFEDMTLLIEQVEEELLQTRFVDRRTYEKIESLGKIDTDFLIFTPQSLDKSSFLPRSVWDHFRAKLLVRNEYPAAVIEYVITLYEDEKWTMEEDFDLQTSLRHIAKQTVPERMIKIEAGKRIISTGETVTPQHVAMINAMKGEIRKHRYLPNAKRIFGSCLLSVVLLGVSGIYLYLFHPEIIRNRRKLALLLTTVFITLFVAKVVDYLMVYVPGNWIDSVRFPLFVPLASIVLTVLLGTQIALYASGFLGVALSLSLAVEPNRFIVVNLIAAVLSLVFSRNLRRRREVFSVALKVWACLIPVMIAFNGIEQWHWDSYLVTDLATSLFFMVAMAAVALILLPMLESLFQVITDMTLVEYLDPSNELLRRLSIELPGTYQHCLVVGNLAESAAQAIGANGLFCRVSTLYHDIGKLVNPHYFTENQTVGFNIHQLLTPIESSQVIMAHVSDGELLARKHHLPQTFIDIIREHHGTTLVYYFYHKQVEQMGGERALVDEKEFRYPGPKPKSRESAIIMIADAVEAISRSLEEVSEAKITQMVGNLIRERIEDGQLDESLLTFKELELVRKQLIRTLVLAHHLRVKYPERPKAP